MHYVALPLVVLLLAPGALWAAEAKPNPGDMVNNPPYAQWSEFKPGTRVTQREVVTLPNGEKVEQIITHKLLSRDQHQAVVETIATEGAVGGRKSGAAESSKTITTFPARVKMSEVDTPADASSSLTQGVEDIDVKGKKVSTEWTELVTHKGDEVITEKEWTARDIPGGLIKRTVTHKKGDTVVSDSVLELVNFK